MEVPLDEKYQTVKELIGSADSVAVAFSGGVDSSLVLKAALDVLPEKTAALLAVSLLQTKQEREYALSIAEELGCHLHILEIDPLSWPEFTANPPDRCYYCKYRIYSLFHDIIADQAIQILLDGTNIDDLRSNRPGLRAIRELGVRTPLADAGLTKEEVRRLARQLEITSWNRLSSSCLATRIQAGSIISAVKIGTIAKCESYLNTLGFIGCRVRLDNEWSATVELISGDTMKCCDKSVLTGVMNFFSSQGIEKVFLDLSERPCNIFLD